MDMYLVFFNILFTKVGAMQRGDLWHRRWKDRRCWFILNFDIDICIISYIIEGSLEVKLPTIWTDEKQSREEAERRERLKERRVEEKE